MQVMRRLRVRRETAAVIIEVVGGICLVAGLAMIYLPLAFVVAGATLVFIAQGID